MLINENRLAGTPVLRILGEGSG